MESECRKTEEMSNHFQYICTVSDLPRPCLFPCPFLPVSLFFFLFSFPLSPYAAHNWPSPACIIAFLSTQSSFCPRFTINSILSTRCFQTGLSRAHGHPVLTVSLFMGSDNFTLLLRLVVAQLILEHVFWYQTARDVGKVSLDVEPVCLVAVECC